MFPGSRISDSDDLSGYLRFQVLVQRDMHLLLPNDIKSLLLWIAYIGHLLFSKSGFYYCIVAFHHIV